MAQADADDPEPGPPASRAGRMRDMALGAGFLIFAVLLWFWLIPVWASGHGPHVITAQIVAILIGALAILMLVLTALGLVVQRDDLNEDPFVQTQLGQDPAALYAIIAVWAIYTFFMGTLGFYLSSALAMPATMWLLGMRNPVLIVTVPAGALLAVYVVFDVLLQVRLPVGDLPSLFGAV